VTKHDDQGNPPGILDDLLEDILPIINDRLAEAGVKLQQRPLQAAGLFVEKWVVRVDNDTTDNFLDKPWFKTIYDLVVEWYHKRYGSAALEDTASSLLGIVLLFGSPAELRVPLSVAEHDVPGETIWLSLPDNVLPQEDVRRWFVSQPRWGDLGQDDVGCAIDDAKEVGRSLRSIHRSLTEASYRTDNERRLARTIENDLQDAARDVLAMSNGGRLTAVWKLHLATEKSLKVLLCNHNQDYPRTHDLRSLLSCATRLVSESLDPEDITVFPSDAEAVRARYGEGPSRSLAEVMDLYSATLRAAKGYTDLLRRKLRIGGARFLIRRFPWAAK